MVPTTRSFQVRRQTEPFQPRPTSLKSRIDSVLTLVSHQASLNKFTLLLFLKHPWMFRACGSSVLLHSFGRRRPNYPRALGERYHHAATYLAASIKRLHPRASCWLTALIQCFYITQTKRDVVLLQAFMMSFYTLYKFNHLCLPSKSQISISITYACRIPIQQTIINHASGRFT